MLSLQFLCFMFNYCIFTILWEKHPLGDWTSSGCGVEPVCLIWVSIGGWWSQHRKNPCALQEEGTQLVLQQILAEGCFQFSPCPWISGGLRGDNLEVVLGSFSALWVRVSAISALVQKQSHQHAETGAPPTSFTAQLSILTTELYFSDFGPWGDHIVCMVVLFPLSPFLFRDHIAPVTSRGCCKNNRLKITKNCL